MPYKLFVEIGRVVLIESGPQAGKIAVIINVIDQNRVLIEGPTSGVKRQAYRLKQLRLTKYKVDGLKWHSRQGFVIKALKEAKIEEQWAEDPMCKQLKKVETRKAMGDFDRYKLCVAKAKRNAILNEMVEKKVAALKEAGKM